MPWLPTQTPNVYDCRDFCTTYYHKGFPHSYKPVFAFSELVCLK